MEQVVERNHRAKVEKTGTTRVGCGAWKSHPYATPESERALCILWFLVKHHQGKIDSVKYRVKRKPWKLIHKQFVEITGMTTITTQQGGTRPITPAMLRGRWENMTHVYENGGERKEFSDNDTECPIRNRNLIPYLGEALQMVTDYFGVYNGV